MKRGNLLLVFAFSVMFLISIFSFLPMVSGTHCTATSEDNCYNNPDGDPDKPNVFSICGGQDNKFITYHYCQWNDTSSACEAKYLEMFDCASLLNHAYCDSYLTYEGDFISEAVWYYSGYCKPMAYGSGFDVNAGCEIKLKTVCKSDEYCTQADEDFLGQPDYECVKYPAAEDMPINPEFADEDEGTAEAGGETSNSLNQLLGSKSLIFKTALAILLVALILLAVIYFVGSYLF